MEFVPTITRGNAHPCFCFTSMIQLNTARKRKQMPPLNKVQLGVQIRFTMGQIPVTCKQDAGSEEQQAGSDKAADGLPRLRVHKPLPGKEAEDHGAQRGDEAQSEIPAAVVCERVFAEETS